MEDKQEKVGGIMNNKFFMEKKELTCTFINLIVIKMFFTYPRVMVMNSGNGAWIQMIYVSLVCFGLFFLINALNKKTEMEDIFRISEKLGGSFLRVIVGVMVMFIMLINLAMNIRVFPESISTVLLPNTPTNFIMLLFIIAISIGAYMGIYSIGRIHSLLMPIIAIVMVAFFIMLIPDINVNNIFPLVGTGTYNVFVKGLRSISVFADMMLIYIIMPFCKNKRDAKRSVSYAFLIGGISSVLMLLLYVLVYPYPISSEFILPAYQLARIVNISQYFQRLEAFFEFAWSLAMLLYASFYLFVICYTFTQTFKTKYYRQVIIPIVVLAAAIGFVPTNFVTFVSDGYVVSRIVYPLLYIIPAVLGIGYSIKKRKRKGGKGIENN